MAGGGQVRVEGFGGTSEMTPQIKAIVIKFDDMNLNPRIHRVEAKNQLPQVIL